MNSGVVSHEEVLKGVYDFLAYFGYRDSLIALQAESGVPYNVINVAAEGRAPAPKRRDSSAVGQLRADAFPAPSADALEAAVTQGSWPEVLSVYVDGLSLPDEVRATLYETIFEEMLQLHGLLPAAKAFFNNAPVFSDMRKNTPARVARLERMLQSFDAAMWEDEKNKRGGAVSAEVQRRRGDVLRLLQGAIQFTTEPYLGGLAAALYYAANGAGGVAPGPAAKRQRSEGGTAAVASHGPSASAAAAMAFLGYPLKAPHTIDKKLDCSGSERNVSCCAALPNAVVLLGRADGTVDFIDQATGEAAGPSVSHTQGVLTLCLDEPMRHDSSSSGNMPDDEGASADGTAASPYWVAVGYRDGWVKVYNAQTHKLVRRFAQAHSMGVTAMSFLGHRHPDELYGHHRLLLTGSYDASIKLLALASGAVLYSVTNAHHGAFVNALCSLPFASAQAPEFTGVAVSAGNDGTLAFWRLLPDAEEIAEDEDKEAADGGVAKRKTELLVRVGTNMNLRALHVECRDAVATALTVLPPPLLPPSVEGTLPNAAEVTGELFIVTRAAVALVLSVSISLKPAADDTPPVRPSLLALLQSRKTLRHAVAMVSRHATVTAEAASGVVGGASAAPGVPMLSVHAADEEGTVALYNVEMSWRDAARWQSFGGAVAVTQPTDESAVIITDVGRSVPDVRVCAVPPSAHSSRFAVAASAESLQSFYLLE